MDSMRVCRTCGQAKPLSSFHHGDKGGKTRCTVCVAEWGRQYRARLVAGHPSPSHPITPDGMRVCRTCGENKPVTEYFLANGVVMTRCKQCHTALNMENKRRRAAEKKAAEAAIPPPDTKRCPRCGETLPLDAFYAVKDTKTGTKPYCKPCQLAYQREWRAQHPGLYTEQSREQSSNHAYGKYGSPPKAVKKWRDEMVRLQDNTCPICARPFDRTRIPVIDHCHATDRLRGVICRLCNAGMGSLGDDPELLLRAYEYLTLDMDD